MPLLHFGLANHAGPGGAGSPSAPIIPSDLPGLLRWGKADGLGFADNDPIGTFTDLSGNGNDFTQTGSLRPLFKTAIQNGLAALLFDGTDDYLTCDGMASAFGGTNKPWSFFVAFKSTGLPVDPVEFSRVLFGAADLVNSGAQAPPPHLVGFGQYGLGDAYMTQVRDSSNHSKALQAGVLDTSAWHTAFVTFDGTTKSIYLDGNLLAANVQTEGNMVCNAVTYGAHRGYGYLIDRYKGYWGEDGIYDRALSAHDVARLDTYLRGRWGLSPVAPTWDPAILQPSLRGWWRDDCWYGYANNDTPTAWYGRVFAYPLDINTEWKLEGSATFKTAILNGRDAALHNGTGQSWARDSLASIASGTSRPFTVFGAFKATDLSSNRTIFSFGRNADAVPVHALTLLSSGSYRAFRRDNAGSSATRTAGTPDTNLHTFVHIYDGTNVTLYLDGSAIINGLSLSTGTLTLDQFGVGQFRQGGSPSEFFQGYLGEIGLMDTAIGGADLASLNAYLSARW